jgi:hypothetical protein
MMTNHQLAKAIIKIVILIGIVAVATYFFQH